jgi:ribosomal-protein-alanine N-acetyltransferase
MVDSEIMAYALRVMEEEDIPQVQVIDRDAFPTTWPPPAFKRELRNNNLAHYLVAWDTENTHEEWTARTGIAAAAASGGSDTAKSRVAGAVRRLFGRDDGDGLEPTEELLVGYLGLWTVLDEGHIVSVGVRSSHRGLGIGELLLIGSIEQSLLFSCTRLTLEVRVSNEVAQNLYRKYDLRITGRRKRYYTDDGEDAFIMTVEGIDTPQYRELLTEVRTRHSEQRGVSTRNYD